MASADLVPVRTCPECGETKEATTANWYQRRTRTGWEKTCKECRNKQKRAREQAISEAEYKFRAGLRVTAHDMKLVELAERRRASRRKYQQRVQREDPERYQQWHKNYRERNQEVFRERSRMNHWLRLGEPERQKAPAKRDGFYREGLNFAEEAFPPEPFAEWIERTFGSRANAITEAPTYLGMNERTVRKVLDRDGMVTIRTVDRAFVAFGRPDLLNELYPIEAT